MASAERFGCQTEHLLDLMGRALLPKTVISLKVAELIRQSIAQNVLSESSSEAPWELDE